MRIDEIILEDHAFGTNGSDYNDGKVSYNSVKKAFYIVAPIGEGVNLVCIQFLNGDCIFTTTDTEDVNRAITGVLKPMLRPRNMALALEHMELIGEMFGAILRKYRNRIGTVRFASYNNTNARKLKLILSKSVFKSQMLRYRYEYIETMVDEDTGAILHVYDKKS